MTGLISTDIEEAAARLRAGGLVAIPTETVYGLAANAEDDEAVKRIFAVKGRPTSHPLIVHLSVDALGGPAGNTHWANHGFDGWARDVTPAMRVLADTCWPGPLTMLVDAGPRVHPVVTGGRPTVGLRVPSHPLTEALLDLTGFGLAAPSANRFGLVSPTTAEHVASDLEGFLDPDRDLILDGGPSAVGVESTIVDLTADPPQLLRAGAITADDIAVLIASAVADADGPSRASGMLSSHYAPAARVVLVEHRDQAARAVAADRDAGLLVDVLDRSDDPVTAAQHLYSDLRAADQRGLDVLVVVLPAPNGVGVAVRDRLVKAASDRPSRVDSGH